MKRLGLVILLALILGAPHTLAVYAHEDESDESPATVAQPHDDDAEHEDDHADRISALKDARTDRLQQRKEHLQRALEQREKQLSDRQAKRCEFIKAKLQFHRDKAAEIRQHRNDRYQKIIDRLDALADRLDAQDIDSSGLRAAIQRLTSLVNDYAGSFTAYESQLLEAIVSACDDGEITKQEIADLRDLLVRLRRNAETVHTFIREGLKPALTTIKTEVKEAREAANEAKETDGQTVPGTDSMPPPPVETPDADQSTSTN